MQISRLNPFGYEATTEKGNKYKATNKIRAYKADEEAEKLNTNA